MTLIRTLDGKEYNFDEADIRTLDFIVSSPVANNFFKSLDGMNGVIDYGTTFGEREITGYFLAKSSDIPTFSLLRDEIFSYLSTGQPFYLIESRMGGKQWLVKVKDSYDIPQKGFLGKFDVKFVVMSGFAESILTTQDIQKNGLVNSGDWSFGMGLESVDDSELVYTHTGNSFKVFNAGNVEVHPFEAFLKIEIKNVTGSSQKFSLINRTNGSRLVINKAVASSEVWIIDGPVIKRNSLMAASDTSKEFISLVPGWNTFEITGATSATVSFDFKFLYR